LHSFVDVLSPATPTWFSVTYFNKLGYVQQGFTSSADTTNAAINAVSVKGGRGTNWEDGLLKAAGTFASDPRSTAANVIVFASDGAPTVHNAPGNDLSNAVDAANDIKGDGIRIITVGIGQHVNTNNMHSISSEDAYYTAAEFSDLSATFAQIATDLCGGTITVHKVLDQDGNVSTTNDQTPGGAGWNFSITGGEGSEALVTDSTGTTEAVVEADGNYDVTESEKTGYTLVGATCSTGGTFSAEDHAITGVPVTGQDIVTCTFYNKPVETPPVCDSNKELTFVSSEQTLVGDSAAVPLISPIDAWTKDIASPAVWIWSTDGTGEDTTATSSPQTFVHAFNVVGTVLSASLKIAADNGLRVTMTNAEMTDAEVIDNSTVEKNYDPSQTYDVTSLVKSGTNTLKAEVTNFGLPASDFSINPGGLIYSLTVRADECTAPPVQTYTIIATQGDHGSITPAGTTVVTSGGSQTFSMTPESGYVLADVFVDGVSQGAMASYTFSNISANHTITASFSAIQEPEPGSDLVLTKVVDDATPDVGQNIVYTITVTNDGLDDATGVTVADVLPAGLSFVATSTADTLGVYREGVWTIGNLAAEASATLHITATVTGEAGQVIQNVATAAVGQESTDPDLDNNANDPASASVTVNTVTVPPVVPPGGGGGGGGGGSCAPGFVFNPTTFTCEPVGQVLGVSTAGQGEVLGASCGLYMDRYVKRGGVKNDAEQVTKLQAFLVKHGFGTFTPTGFFGPLTEAGVKAFQAKYADEILKPWGLPAPTGLAYLTTLRQINLIECPDLVIPVPTLIPWSSNPGVQ